MRLSLLWIALGLLASSSGQEDDQVKLMKYMCEKHNACLTHNNCTCVKKNLCRNSTTTDSDEDDFYGEDQLDLRNTFGVCTYLETCCKPEDIIPAKPVPKTSTQCGLRNSRGVYYRIDNAANEARYAEFPWVVGIKGQHEVRPNNGSAFLSVGSLIHPQAVLTAAHRVKGKDNLMVVGGEWDTESEKELYPTQSRGVRKVIVHEEFEKRAVLNDVALLILDQPFDTSVPHIKTICLPDPGENMDDRNKCIASGWGTDKFGEEGRYQAILKKIDDLPMVPKTRCQEALRKTKLGPRFRLHESFVCAGGVIGKDTCKGDGGGPLVCPSKTNPKKYVQAGIVAWGIGCNNENPAVYVNVPHFVNWIENKLEAENVSLEP